MVGVSIISRLSDALGRRRVGAALFLATLALTACGPTVQPTTAPAETEPPAAATDTVPSAKLAPAFQLPNAAGEMVSLASYADSKNVVLVFYRGFW